MGFFTARKRTNPFAERAQQQQQKAVQPKPAPAPTPTQPNPKPPMLTPEEQRDTDQPLGDLREVAKLAEGGVVAPVRSEEETLAENGAPEFIIPLKAGPLPEAVDFEREDTSLEPVKRGRGRPRPQETLDRDNAVYELLANAGEFGMPKAAIAVDLGEKEQQVYSSLRQLTKEGRAQNRYVKDVGYRWFAV
jgi:hypothetical protein